MDNYTSKNTVGWGNESQADKDNGAVGWGGRKQYPSADELKNDLEVQHLDKVHDNSYRASTTPR